MSSLSDSPRLTLHLHVLSLILDRCEVEAPMRPGIKHGDERFEGNLGARFPIIQFPLPTEALSRVKNEVLIRVA